MCFFEVVTVSNLLDSTKKLKKRSTGIHVSLPPLHFFRRKPSSHSLATAQQNPRPPRNTAFIILQLAA